LIKRANGRLRLKTGIINLNIDKKKNDDDDDRYDSHDGAIYRYYIRKC
jgi:hypothetical protein